MKKKIAVVIPVYNEHKTIYSLVSTIHAKYPFLEIILVDDGSKPPLSLPKNLCIHLLTNEKNFGKGISLRKGIQYALEALHADWLITMDADGQHSPDDIEGFLQHLTEHPFVIGKRIFSKQYMPFDRILSNTLSSFLLSQKLKTRIKDSQCGFRGFHKDAAVKLLECKENGFQFETESIIMLVRSGIYPVFTPIKTIYNGSISHINKISDILTFIKLYFTR